MAEELLCHFFEICSHLLLKDKLRKYKTVYHFVQMGINLNVLILKCRTTLNVIHVPFDLQLVLMPISTKWSRKFHLFRSSASFTTNSN